MAEIERLRAERDDLMKANALLHALISNREAEIERAYDQLHNEREDAQAEIERLKAELVKALGTQEVWQR